MRILVADNQLKVRFALRTLLGRQTGLEIVGEADTAEELLIQAETTCPDLVLLHWRLHGAESNLFMVLKKVCPGVRVIVLSARPEARTEALGAGADDFVCKMDPPEKLLAAIERCKSGESNRRRQRRPAKQPLEKTVPEAPRALGYRPT